MPVRHRRRVQPLIFRSALQLRLVRVIVVVRGPRAGPVPGKTTVSAVVDDGTEEESGNGGTGCDEDTIVFNSVASQMWSNTMARE